MGFFGFILVVLWALVTFSGFVVGMESWLGVPWVLSFVIAVCITWFGAFGALAMGLVSFYGMTSVFEWHWLIALFVCFPMPFLMFLGVFSSGFGALFGKIGASFRKP